jgi:hypothetical protein
MNCFNIRELQGILKRKFFTDLVNSHDHRELLDQSMIGLRYKSNSSINLDSDVLSFYNYGTHNTPSMKFTSFLSKNSSSDVKVYSTLNNFESTILDFFNKNASSSSMSLSFFFVSKNYIADLFSLLTSFNI